MNFLSLFYQKKRHSSISPQTYFFNKKKEKDTFEISPIHKKALSLIQKHAQAVLDIGCGQGELITLCLQKHITSYGIDFVSQFIEHAKSQIKEAHFFHKSAIEVDQLPISKVDTVFALGVLSYLSPDELKENFKQVFNILKSNGIYVIRTNQPFNKIGNFILKLKNKEYQSLANFYPLSVYTQVGTSAGFSVKETWLSIDDKQNQSPWKAMFLSFFKLFFASRWIVYEKKDTQN